MKIKSLFLLTLPMLLFSCGGGTSSLSREEESFAPSSVVSNADSSAMPSSSASPATVHDLAPDYHDFVEKYMAKLSSFTSYKSVTKGSTKSKVLFVETTQSIDVTSIKGEYNYLKNESHGAVDTVHEAYFHDGNALVQNKDEAAFSKLSMKEYLDTYGAITLKAIPSRKGPSPRLAKKKGRAMPIPSPLTSRKPRPTSASR